MGITGSMLVFHKKIQSFENRHVWLVKNTNPINIDKAYNKIRTDFPSAEIRLTRFSRNPSETLLFSIKKDEKHLLVFSHPSTGNILEVKDNLKTFLNIILDIHYSFRAGGVGKILVFIVGLVFLASLLTGFTIYRKHFLKVILFQIPIKRTSGRYVATLHHYVGVWALLLNFILVITGVLIAFDNISGHKSTAELSPPPLTASINKALALIEQKYPQFIPTYIWFPKSKDEPVRINGKIANDPFYWTQYYNNIEVGPQTGKIYPLQLTSKDKLSKKLASVVGVIHLVEFDNLVGKILFCLAGLSAPVLSLTGFFMWRRRQRKIRAVKTDFR